MPPAHRPRRGVLDRHDDVPSGDAVDGLARAGVDGDRRAARLARLAHALGAHEAAVRAGEEQRPAISVCRCPTTRPRPSITVTVAVPAPVRGGG